MPEKVSNGLLQAYMPDFCKAVDLVISPSEGMKKVLSTLGVKDPIEVVPNGVDLDLFYKAKPRPRAEFGLSDKDILLVYAGRIAPEKSLDLLLHSFAGIVQAISNVHLFIIGRGQEQYEDNLINLTYDLGLKERVHFTGLIPYDQLPSYLAMCDAFVTASITEVHPLSVIDTVEDGKTGFLATDNIAAFTAKLTRLCLDTDLRAQMGRSAREASSIFAIERTTSVMLKHYEQLAQNERPKKPEREARLRRILKEFLQ
jgi:1,2-diacylglycerol 3-alpha-glucosyltransferase